MRSGCVEVSVSSARASRLGALGFGVCRVQQPLATTIAWAKLCLGCVMWSFWWLGGVSFECRCPFRCEGVPGVGLKTFVLARARVRISLRV